MFKYKSKIGKGSLNSARLTIPKNVTEFLDISPGDYVKWIVNVDEKGVNVQIEKIK